MIQGTHEDFRTEFPPCPTLDEQTAAVCFTGLENYPSNPPFHPPEPFPEYTGRHVDPSNQVYFHLRKTLLSLGLDSSNIGTKRWNPFGSFIEPGMTVFIKPNLVQQCHSCGKSVFSIVVHASVLRPILDYVCIALDGRGRIIIGDSQVADARFEDVLTVSHLRALLEWYGSESAIPIECFDLRAKRRCRSWLYGRWKWIDQAYDPRGYTYVDLSTISMFHGLDPKRLRIAIASHNDMFKHHSNGHHRYCFPNSFLQSDAVISVAKLKTHRRTGVTLALKNFMGLPALKESLPHFITGAPGDGGDQYEHPSRRKRICTRLHDRIQSCKFVPEKFALALLKRAIWETNLLVPFKDPIYEGMWHGNDTLWRTLLDLNRVALYADKEGRIAATPQRNLFCIIDGIIGGEGNGPLSPDPVAAGVLIAGANPVTTDAVASALMGFDVEKIPLIRHALEQKDHVCPFFRGSREGIRIVNGERTLTLQEFASERKYSFEPHPNWKGQIELE